MTGQKPIDPATAGPGESGRMDKILDAGFKQPAGESVLIQSDSLTTDDPAFRSAVEDVVGTVARLGVVTNVRSPLDPANQGQISKDGRSALVDFQIRGASDDAAKKLGPIVAAVDSTKAAHPGLFIGQFGYASADEQLGDVGKKDLKKAGLFSVPITLIILVVAFGALVAAGIPLLLALTAVFATLGIVAASSHALPVSDSVGAIVLLIGLAVGVDYSMFYLKREREERAAGRSEQAALEAAAATSGRSVLISGLTVIVAMAGMFLTGDKGFASFGLATMIVVAVAMLGSLTVLPALLSWLGDRVDRLHVPFVGRLRRDDGEGRIWGVIIDRVLRRPALSAAVATGALVALALPALHMHTVIPGPDTFPQDLPAIQTYNRVQEVFPGTEIAGERRGQGRERQRTRGEGRDHADGGRGARDRAALPARSRSTSTRTPRSPTSRSRSTARAPTSRRSRRSEHCARRCFPARSARSPTSSTASRASPPARPTSTT